MEKDIYKQKIVQETLQKLKLEDLDSKYAIILGHLFDSGYNFRVQEEKESKIIKAKVKDTGEVIEVEEELDYLNGLFCYLDINTKKDYTINELDFNI